MGGKRREDITVEPIELLPKEGEVIAGVRLHAAFFQCSRCGAIKPGVDVGQKPGSVQLMSGLGKAEA
jgi:hypothetical protein